MPYDAFISYSHAADGALAPALQRGLHRLAKPWYALRALRVFRDETNLAAEPGLWLSIEAALAQSRFLILMASPKAAQSIWVAKELDWWLANRDAAHLLIVQSAGELHWSDARNDFDWSTTDALPASIARRFPDEPKYVDLRWAHGSAPLTIDNPAFRAAVLDLDAPIHGQEKDLLDGEDVRQQRRTRRFVRSGVAGLLVLTAASAMLAFIANQQRGIAEEQARIALARQLAAQSGLILRQNPESLPLAVLLALESVARAPSFEGNQALRSALSLLPQIEATSTTLGTPDRGRVRALAFGADGRLLAGAREDGTAELIEVGTHRSIALLAHDTNPGAVVEAPGTGIDWKAPGVDAEVVALAFSADGQALATASNDHTARVWSTATGRETARLAHDDSVTSVAFHPQRPWLATGSKDGGARLWNLTDAALLKRFDGDDEVRGVAFSPNGRWLATIDTGGCTRLVDLQTDQASPRHWCWGSAGLGLVFSADGTRLATANGDRAGVYDVASGQRLFEATHLSRREDGDPEAFKWIVQVAFSADGEWLATAGRDSTARVWDLVTKTEVVRLQHPAPVASVAFSPDGAALLTASADGTARLWDLPSGHERLRAVYPGGSEEAVFSPQGTSVATSGIDGSIDLWRLNPGDQASSVAAAASGTTAAVSSAETAALAADGRIASIDAKGELRLWSAGGMLLAQRSGLYGAKQIVFGEGGHTLVVRTRSPAVSLFDLQQGLDPIALAGVRDADEAAVSASFIVARDRRARRLLAWSASDGAALPMSEADDPSEPLLDATGRHVATLHQDSRGAGTIRVRSLPEGRETGRIAIDHKPDFALAPGGTLLAISGRSRANEQAPWLGHVDLIDVATGQPTQRLAEERALSGLRFTPDGRHLVTLGDASGEMRVWRVADGRRVASLQQPSEIQAVRFSAQGDVVATRSTGQIRFWHLADGRLLSQVETTSAFKDFGFGPDGRRLVSASAGGSVVSWLWRDDDLRDEACRRLKRNLDADEWRLHLGAEPYRATCASLPAAR